MNTVKAFGREYQLDFSQEGTVLLKWQEGIYTELARVPIKDNKVDMSYTVKINMKARKILTRRLNEMLKGGN
ncbi:hypothetical protein EG878_14780 [Enterococcus faecalis]|nr:hypothetical protein EG878_14780 [Enterococcus faecalis]